MLTEEEVIKFGQKLREAVESGSLDEVKSILEACPECVDKQGEHGITALMVAAFLNKAEIAKELIKAGASLDEKDVMGLTAMMLAAIHGNLEMVDVLINANAGLDEKNGNGVTALMWAVHGEKNEVVKKLINAGANLDENIRGCTALNDAAYQGFSIAVKILLAAGADVKILYCGFFSTLKRAEMGGNAECIDLIKKAEKENRPTCEEVGILPPEKRGRPAKDIFPTLDVKTGVEQQIVAAKP